MNNNEIYNLLRSKDLKGYLLKLNFQFSEKDKFTLIMNSFQSWETKLKLIGELSNSNETENWHEAVKDYNSIITGVNSEVYIFQLAYFEGEKEYCNGIYSSFKAVLKVMNDDKTEFELDCPYKISIFKINSEYPIIEMYYNSELVNNHISFEREQWNGHFVYYPNPFKKGDIVMFNNEKEIEFFIVWGSGVKYEPDKFHLLDNVDQSVMVIPLPKEGIKDIREYVSETHEHISTDLLERVENFYADKIKRMESI